MSSDLTPETAIRIGGWACGYARVLVVATVGDIGISLIDPNGDGNYEEVVTAYRDDTGQRVGGGGSGGFTPGTLGPHGWGEYGSDTRYGVRYAYGRADAPGHHLPPASTGIRRTR
jgi:hypothetical protein